MKVKAAIDLVATATRELYVGSSLTG